MRIDPGPRCCPGARACPLLPVPALAAGFDGRTLGLPGRCPSRAPARVEPVFYVYSGTVEAQGTRFEQAESRLTSDLADLVLRAIEPALVVAFVINPEARITRRGMVGNGSLL